MMQPTRVFRTLPRVNPFQFSIVCSIPCPLQSRQFQTTSVCSTDGVYKALTEMRVKTPWIEALRTQRKQGSDPITTSDTSSKPPEHNLRPKKMSDSYHRVVRNLTGEIPCLIELTPTLIIPLAQDPWLLDNYLNANGHIRWAKESRASLLVILKEP